RVRPYVCELKESQRFILAKGGRRGGADRHYSIRRAFDGRARDSRRRSAIRCSLNRDQGRSRDRRRDCSSLVLAACPLRNRSTFGGRVLRDGIQAAGCRKGGKIYVARQVFLCRP